MIEGTQGIRNIYRADIDGLRAIAVLSVMIYHLNAHWLPGGFVGVDILFVISGFVVAGALAASRAPHAFGFISEYYARRLARIMPALSLTPGATSAEALSRTGTVRVLIGPPVGVVAPPTDAARTRA